MARPEDITTLFVVLTAQCNLRCGYCYQNAKREERMSFDTLRAALDLALRSNNEEVTIVFYGGEPLLEFELLKRGVQYMEANKRGKRVTYSIVTNGLLLTEEVVDFITSYWFDTHLSFDGIPEVQALRGSETFAPLNALLDRLQRDHRGFFRWHLTTTLTLLPKTIPHLSDSARYLVGKGIQKIEINPAVNMDAQWRDDRFAELDAAFAELYDLTVDHYQRTGEIPLSLFERGSHDRRAPIAGRSMCGVATGRVPVVDVDGQVHGCGTFSESFQSFRTAFMRQRIERMRLGAVTSPELESRFRAFPAAVRKAQIFDHKEQKYSSYRRCADCEYLAACSICPMSIGNIPGNDDPHRVPDFLCAYNMISLSYADRFARHANVVPSAAVIPDAVR